MTLLKFKDYPKYNNINVIMWFGYKKNGGSRWDEMRTLLKTTGMAMMILIVGCSQESKSFNNYVNEREVKSMSMDVLDRSSGKSDDEETIDVFFDLIQDVQLTKASKEETLELHKASYDADLRSIQGWFNPEQDTNVSVFNILKDGRLSLIKFEEGIGKYQYMIKEPSPQLYVKLLSYYEEYIEGDIKDVQVLDLLENGEERDITIEGNSFRSSEDLVPVVEGVDDK